MNWIKTSERLPEIDKMVLTAVNYGGVGGIVFIVGYFGGGDRWYDHETSYLTPDYWCEIEPPKV